MKHLFIRLCIFCFCLTQYTQAQGNWQVIGKVINNQPEFTVDKQELIANVNANLLKFSGIKANLTNVRITAIENDSCQLVFSGSTYNTTFYCRIKSLTSIEALGDTSCTTTGCSQEPRGCVVKYDKGEPGYCSPCGNGSDCTKTTSNRSILTK